MLILFMILSLALFYLLAKLLLKQPLKNLLIGNLSVAILLCYLAAIVLTFVHEGHPTDINCFKDWANMLFQNGMSNFYTSDAFTDYPPGYMYVLYVIGAIRSIFSIAYDSYTYLFLIKSPAIIANICTGIFIYAIAVKKTGERNALLLALFYMLNPLVLFNASVWGQVD
ncbi:MAG: hypothetical protein LBU77_01065, partial [Clostridiales bacterium]|nr:hypothetical protein [Clostridiales bacterium]